MHRKAVNKGGRGRIGAPLPHSYRQAMMASNGGEIAAYDDVWNLHPILDKSDRKRLSRSSKYILRETRMMRGCRTMHCSETRLVTTRHHAAAPASMAHCLTAVARLLRDVSIGARDRHGGR
jgi:hypothetical protein